MTKYSYATNQDKALVDNSLLWLSWLIFGKNSPKVETARKLFALQVASINVYPQRTRTTKINKQTPGCCWIDDSNCIHIEMQGYIDSNNSQHKFIKHESVHEHAHAFANLLPLSIPNEKHKKGIIKNGTLLQNCAGMIRTADPQTGILVGQNYYGKMDNETLMDIITSMAINSFDPNSRDGATTDYIFQTEYTHWGNAKTGYSIFTSLTRLAIAAFSNNAFISYQTLINSGKGIFELTTKMQDGSQYRANDFLYGMLFDPLHIDEQFDKFMGEGKWRAFCEWKDRLFLDFLSEQAIPSEDVKQIMNILPDFLNKKINYYLSHGLIDRNGANAINSNFNSIWMAMQTEYRAYFSQKEIDDIKRRARS